jgi:hemerythrin-like domain-containing protein
MSTGAIIGIVVVLVVLAVVAVLLYKFLQRRRLQQKFGPEYDRAVKGSDNRMAAERELVDRQRKHAKLELRPLTPQAKDSYGRHWSRIQEQFVDAPGGAVAEADILVTDLMAERGYPTEGYEKQAELLSVEHSRTLDHYRSAHEISQRDQAGEASTEDLRSAMVHYRTLFQDLLVTSDDVRAPEDDDHRAHNA